MDTKKLRQPHVWGGLLAAGLLYAVSQTSAQPSALDSVTQSAPKETASAEPVQNPYDEVLQALREKKTAAAAAPSPSPGRKPLATPDPLEEKLQEQRSRVAALMQKNAGLQRNVATMKNEAISARRRFDSKIQQLGQRKVNYTTTQLKWINDVLQSVKAQSEEHQLELDRRMSHLLGQQKVFKECHMPPPNPKSKTPPPEPERIAACERDLGLIATYLERMESILSAEHTKMLKTYETAAAQIEATVNGNLSAQRS